MKVVIFVRVSTQEQAKEGYSIGEQIERLNKYCDAMQWTIVETYIDPGYSGGDTDRPGLNTMIKAIQNGNIDKVVVYKLDRLSRSQKDTLYLIEDVFLKNNTDFVSMNENFDTSTPFGRAMIGILAVFAQLEREQIKERMGMGKEARAKSGKWHGGSTEPIGYNYDPTTETLNIDDYEAMQIRELYDLFLQGTPLRSIETMFKEKGYIHKHGVWDPKTMRRLMRRKTHLGYIKYRDQWYPGNHDPIMDEETAKKAVEILDIRYAESKARCNNSQKRTTYLGSLIYCKHCHGRYGKQENSRKKPGREPIYWYMCYSRSKKVKKMVKDPNCRNKNWKVVELDGLVFGEIRKLAMDPEYYKLIKQDKPKTEEPNKVDIIEKEIEKIDTQISRFMDLYGVGTFTMEQVNSKVAPLNETRKGLVRELESLNAEAGRLTEEEFREIIASAADVLDYGDFDEIRAMIESLIYFIEIDNEDIYIHWKFA